MLLNNCRFEISFKNLDQLKKKLDFCIANKIYKINIPCKGLIKKDFLLDVIRFIGENYSKLDVIYHYSLNHQFSNNFENSYRNFIDFLNFCYRYKCKEILIISGTRKRKKFDVVVLLNYLINNSSKNFYFGVAFNPYLKSNEEKLMEKERIKTKISSKLIKSIWLQFGTDLNLLEIEIDFLNKLKYLSGNNNIKIYGSLFLPSKQFLAQFNFRPWRGVYLSEEYLNSIDTAYKISKDILSIYSKNNIIPLIETEFCSEKHLNNLMNLLEN